MKILFQGDSITDAGRDYDNYHNMGNGYPKYASELIKEAYPNMDFEFFNFGISGNRTGQLFDRLYPEAIAHDPDIISILIGINDIWHRYGVNKIATTDAQIELNYRTILTEIKSKTHAKIIMISPYLLDVPHDEPIREDLKTVLPIIYKLADEFADVFIPLDKHFEEAIKTQPHFAYYSDDGIHPNQNGSEFIAKLYLEAVEKLL